MARGARKVLEAEDTGTRKEVHYVCGGVIRLQEQEGKEREMERKER